MLKTYLEISLGMSAVILLILSFTPLLRSRYKAGLRYGIWIICAVMLLIPYRPNPKIAIEVPQIQGESVQSYSALENDNAPQADESIAEKINTADTAAKSSDILQSQTDEIQSKPAQTEPKSETEQRTIDWRRLFTAVWLCGAVIFMLYYIVGYALFRRKIKPWCKSMEIFGYNERPELTYCRSIKSPMLVGFFQPQILFPRSDYAEAELSMILKHELTHFKRGDLWIKLLFTAANALHWFNPAVYLMRRAANRDMEYSCDERVVRNGSKQFREEYSMTILRCASGTGLDAGTAFSTHFSENKKNLKQRFKNILSVKKKRGIIIGTALAAAAVICAGIFGFVNRAETDESYLLLGTDGRNNVDIVMTGELSGGNLIVTFIPRDKVKNYLPDDINTDTVERLRDTLARLTGMELSKYIVMDMSSAETLLEKAGTVSFTIPDLYGDGVGMAYDDPYQDLHISLSPGEHELTAKKIMQVIRYRKGNVNEEGRYNSYENIDKSREEMTMELLQSVVSQKTPGKDKNDDILRAAEAAAGENVITNIGVGDIQAVYKAVIKGRVKFEIFEKERQGRPLYGNVYDVYGPGMNGEITYSECEFDRQEGVFKASFAKGGDKYDIELKEITRYFYYDVYLEGIFGVTKNGEVVEENAHGYYEWLPDRGREPGLVRLEINGGEMGFSPLYDYQSEVTGRDEYGNVTREYNKRIDFVKNQTGSEKTELSTCGKCTVKGECVSGTVYIPEDGICALYTRYKLDEIYLYMLLEADSARYDVTWCGGYDLEVTDEGYTGEFLVKRLDSMEYDSFRGSLTEKKDSISLVSDDGQYEFNASVFGKYDTGSDSIISANDTQKLSYEVERLTVDGETVAIKSGGSNTMWLNKRLGGFHTVLSVLTEDGTERISIQPGASIVYNDRQLGASPVVYDGETAYGTFLVHRGISHGDAMEEITFEDSFRGTVADIYTPNPVIRSDDGRYEAVLRVTAK